MIKGKILIIQGDRKIPHKWHFLIISEIKEKKKISKWENSHKFSTVSWGMFFFYFY